MASMPKLYLSSKENAHNTELINTRSNTILPSVTKLKKTASRHNLEKAAWHRNYSKNQREFTIGKSTLVSI